MNRELNIPFIKTPQPFYLQVDWKVCTLYKLIRITFLVAIFLSLFIIPSKSFAENKDPESGIETDEVLIVLYVKNLGTCEIPSAIRGQDIYLPVVDVFNFLKIRTISGNGFDMISGFFIDPKNIYQIDRVNNLIIYQGKTYPLHPFDFIVTETNLYLKAKFFEQIFGLECKFDYRTLTISLKSELELPAIREMRLEQMHSNFDRIRGQMKADTTIARTYPLFHFGMADWAVNANQNVNGLRDARLNLGLGAILAGGELNSLLSYTANQPFLENQQYYLWRYANNENQVLRQVMVGKISASAVSSIFNPVLGLQFTNAPTINRKSFGTYTLSNFTSPNWTVELYVNGILIDYVKADASGLFTFDVPLIYGSTDVTLRYYGPWGEELSSKQSFSIPFNFLPTKELEYKISGGIVEDDKNSLFGQAKLNYGVTKAITFGGGLEYNTSIPASKNIVFFNTSIRIASNTLFNGEYIYKVRYKGLLTYHLPSNLQLELYYSKYNPNQQAIRLNYTEERRLMISRPFRISGISALSRLALSQNLIQQPVTDLPPTKYTVPEFSLSGASHGISLNITTSAFILDKIITTVYSDVSLSTTLPGGILFTPQIKFDYKLNKISLVRYSFEKRFIKYGVISASYQNNRITNSPLYQIGFRYDFPYARVGVSAMQSNNINSFSEFASGSLIYQPQVNYLDFNVNTNVGRGGLIFIPFLDINNNGKKDQNEPKVNGLNVMVSGGGIQKNRKDTTIAISGLEPYTNYFVELDATGIENMAWRIKKPKMNIAIEPNKLKLIEIPISILGEASGTVYIKRKNEEIGLGRMLVCFYNSDSDLVNKSLTESDGYFSFLGLFPGSYYAKIDGEQLKKLQMTSSPSFLRFTIKSDIDGDVIDGLKFTVQSKAKEFGEPVKELAINKQQEIKTISPPQISDTLNMILAMIFKKHADSLKLANQQQDGKLVNPPQISDTLSTLLALMVKKQSDSLKLANQQPDGKLVNPTQISDTLSTLLALMVKKHADSLKLANQQPDGKLVNPPLISDTLSTLLAVVVKKHADSLKLANQNAKKQITENPVLNEKGIYAVQTRAHSKLSDAQTTQSKLSKIYKQPVVIINEGGLYKVRIIGFNDRDIATALIPKLANQGYPGAFVVGPSQSKEAIVMKETPVKTIEVPVPIEQGDFAVQVGVFSQSSNAYSTQSKLKQVFKQPIAIVQEGGLSKVRFTGFTSRAEALTMLNKIKERGFSDAFIISSEKNKSSLKSSGNQPDIMLKLSPLERTRMENAVVNKNDIFKRAKYGDNAIYAIQIASDKEELPQNTLVVAFKLQTKVESHQDKKEGVTKYITGNYDTYNKALKAKNELVKKGFEDPFIIVIYKGKIMSVKEYNEEKK